MLFIATNLRKHYLVRIGCIEFAIDIEPYFHGYPPKTQASHV